MAAPYFNTTGKRIRLLRQDLNISQTGLAHAMRKLGIDISHQYISELERTDKTPSGDVLSGLARVLGTTTDYLLLLTEDATPPPEHVAQEEQNPKPPRDDRVIYQVPSQATRLLVERLLKVFSELTDAEREYVIATSELLRNMNRPRIIGDDESTKT
jgi:transcriptional regulator with XRE-family HTH domain